MHQQLAKNLPAHLQLEDGQLRYEAMDDPSLSLEERSELNIKQMDEILAQLIK